jgi:hypothetical protein
MCSVPYGFRFEEFHQYWCRSNFARDAPQGYPELFQAWVLMRNLDLRAGIGEIQLLLRKILCEQDLPTSQQGALIFEG